MEQWMEQEPLVTHISTCRFVLPGSGTLIHRNRASHGLALHLSGRTVYHFDTGKEVRVEAHDMVFLPQNSNYHVVSDTRGDCWAINFQLAGQTPFQPFAFHCSNPTPYTDAFAQAVRHWTARDEGYRMKCFSCLYQILYRLKRDDHLDRSDHPKQALLAPALAYLQDHYTQEIINVDHLASLCGISPVYLRRLFNQVYGTSPLKYINGLKLELAKELLTSQLYSIRELAALTGYSDECVFSREFKKATGLSPRSYLAAQHPRSATP